MKKEKRNTRKEKKLKKTNARNHRNAQNDFHYEALTKSGIACLGKDLYSGAISFTDITYHTSRENEKRAIFQRYMELLNSLVSTTGIQLFKYNRFINREDFEKTVLFHQENDDYDILRNEYNKALLSSTLNGKNTVECLNQIVFTVKEDSFEQAKKTIINLGKNYCSKLEQFGCRCKLLNGYERLETIFNLLYPLEVFQFSYDSLEKSKLDTKNFIAPQEFIWNESPSYFRINERYAKVLRLQDYSTELSDRFITDLMNIDTNISISFHIQAIERGEDVSILNNHIVQLETEIGSKQSSAERNNQNPNFLPYELRQSYTEAQELLEDVRERNQRLFICQLLVFLNADSKESLKEIEKAVMQKSKEHMTILKSVNYFKNKALNSILPLGKTELPYARTLNTASTGILIPFNSKELKNKNGCFYGVNPTTGSLITPDRRELNSPSGLVLASPGSGKSFFVKNESTWTFLRDNRCNIIFIDPENEYVKLTERLNGAVLKVDPRSRVRLNPFDGNIYDDDYISNKVDIIMTICSEILEIGTLPATLKSFIESTVRRMCKRYITECETSKITGIKPKIPTLTLFADELKELNNSLEFKNGELESLIWALGMYTEDGTYNLFGHESTIDMNNKMTCYSIRDIGKTLKPLGMVIILESIWETIIKNFEKGIRTIINCDEFHILLKNPYALEFFFSLFKRARKYGAIITGITQNVEEILLNDAARMMLSNSDWLVLLNQQPNDREQIGRLLNLSDTELDCISNSKKGSGLIKFGKEIVPFENDFPKDSELYSLWTTDFSERMNKELNG